jgi:hypothetical protein
MTGRVRISTKDAQEILLSTGEWAAIVMAADNIDLRPELRGLCITVRDTVRLEKGYPVPHSSFVVLNSGDYALDTLVECARADAPNIGYCAFLCALILETE